MTLAEFEIRLKNVQWFIDYHRKGLASCEQIADSIQREMFASTPDRRIADRRVADELKGEFYERRKAQRRLAAGEVSRG